MHNLGKSPYCWLEFDAAGTPVDESALAAVTQMLSDSDAEDLVVISHGWNNDKANAISLYGRLWENVVPALTTKLPERVAVCGVLWPAKAFRDDFDVEALTSIAGGNTLSVHGGTTVRDLSPAELEVVIGDFMEVFGLAGSAAAMTAREAAGGLTNSISNKLFASARPLVATLDGDGELEQDAKPITSGNDPQQMLSALAAPPRGKLAPGAGTAMGLGSDISSAISGARAAAARFLNYLTFFEMKRRAGLVGSALGGSALPMLMPERSVRLHLIGHSFGARLVSAAANALSSPSGLEFASLTLLQGAFSQNAFRKSVAPGVAGAFPAVIGKPSGPLSVTHTHNDLACTLAYAFASRLSGDITTAIGDKDDLFGAMGANGPQGLDEGAFVPDSDGTTFHPARGKVNTFLADQYIVKTATSDAHNNVANETVGRLVASVVEA